MTLRLSRPALAGATAALLVLGAFAILIVLSHGSAGRSGETGGAVASAASRPAASRAATRRPSAAVGTVHRAGGSVVAAAPAPARAAGAGATAIAAAAAVEQPDPEASLSSPAPAGLHHASASTPATAAEMIAPGAPSDAQVRQELAQMNAAIASERSQAQKIAASGGSIGGAGTVSPPADVPAVIARVIAGADAIATFPYVYGGGHASFVDNAYDCSGSVGYALAAGGLLTAPETSGQLESWGVPGPGRYITIEANAGHVYMFVDGLRYDTAGRSGVFGSRWQTGYDPGGGADNTGFVTRHWPGL